MSHRQGILAALANSLVVWVVVVAAVAMIMGNILLIGPIVFLLALLPLLPIRLSGRSLRSTGADMVFGAVDTGFLGVAALIGAELGGVLGAVVGGLVGDSITDGFVGIFEGHVSEYRRRHGIEEAPTPLNASMGKISGCLRGAGATLTVAWTIVGIALP
ncbi:MAG: hypothetical protein JXA58_01710 [Dehalococcoidia bacterium]|nr:hypothetical protein [Dehalococcoidia bacterium]